jgi:flavodoxin
MKTAVVFYTLDGNCAFVAEKIKAPLNAELIQLYTQDDKKRGKFGKFFWGGGMVFRGIKPPLKPYTFDPSAYDLIVIGVPVWAGNPAPPILTFLSGAGISGKKIALFVCHGGGKGAALDKLKAMIAGNDIVAEADFINPAAAAGDEINRQIEEWAKKLTGNS